MTRSLEAARESRQAKLDKALLLVCEGGLEDSLSHAGAELQGFSVKFRGADVLLTARVVLAGRRQIAFVGSESLGGVLRKLAREARADALNWKEDTWAQK